MFDAFRRGVGHTSGKIPRCIVFLRKQKNCDFNYSGYLLSYFPRARKIAIMKFDIKNFIKNFVSMEI